MSNSKESGKLPRPVWVLSLVSFFADISSEMVYPLLPLFLVSVLHASKTQFGAIEGAAVFVVAIMSAIAGIQSDRKGKLGGRVKWIRWGYGLPVLGKALIAVATAWPVVLAGRLTDRFGKGLRGAPRDALIADSVTKEQRGAAFGLHRAFDTAGAITGVLLSALLLWWFTGTPQSSPLSDGRALPDDTPGWLYRIIFAVGAMLGVASLVLTYFVRESDSLTALSNETTTADEAKPISLRQNLLSLPRSYWYVLGALVLFSFANSSDAFLLLRTRELGYSPWAVVLIYAVYNVFYSALSYPAGKLSDSLGRWKIMVVGWVIYVLVYFGIAVLPTSQAWGMWPLMATYGIYMALTDGVGKALLADHSPSHLRGAAMGLFYGITGLATLIASVITGILWDTVGASMALLTGAFLAVAALVVLIAIRNWIQPTPEISSNILTTNQLGPDA